MDFGVASPHFATFKATLTRKDHMNTNRVTCPFSLLRNQKIKVIYHGYITEPKISNRNEYS